MNQYTEMIRETVENYLLELREVEKKRKPLDGIFGFASSSKNNACHDRFDQRVEEVLQQTLTDGATAEEIAETMACVLLEMTDPRDMRTCAINMIATQRHCLPLVDRLTQALSTDLAAWYEKAWPRRTRLPVQNELLEALKTKV